MRDDVVQIDLRVPGTERGRGGAPRGVGGRQVDLTAQLVRAGWAYVTDEVVGIGLADREVRNCPKPLALDGSSRAVLGLSPSPVATPRWPSWGHGRRCPAAPTRGDGPSHLRPGARSHAVPLDAVEAVGALAEHALNLRVVGQPGLDALVELARRVPAFRLRHGGGAPAVEAIGSLVK